MIAEEKEKGKGREMVRFCELTGMTQADMAGITSFFMGVSIASVFIGNVLFWAFKEFLRISETLIDSAVDMLFKYIGKKWHR